ncbi:MAG: DUF6171 family protein [Clostridia bacterium]|nr:DUF6171 family protein [Clostridia bacterium]
MDSGARICRKCLLADMADRRPLYELVREYIESLDADIRTGDDVYRERLAVCRACEYLNAGTCAKCGCYAEARAAKKRISCPDVPPRWLPEK